MVVEPVGTLLTQTTPYTVQTNFGCNGTYQVPDITPSSPQPMLSALSVGNGRSYTLGYESTPNYPTSITSRLASIGLPNGGGISYTYSGGNNGVYCDAATNYGAVPPIMTRTIDDGVGHARTWTYAFSDPYNPSQITTTTTVTDPEQNQIAHRFAGSFQTEETDATPQGQVLRTSITCYNGNFTNCPTPSTLPDPRGYGYVAQTDVFTTFDTPGVYSLVETQLNAYGLPTAESDYDFGTVTLGQAPAGTPFKRTVMTYGSWNGSGCSPVNTQLANGISTINDRLCEVQIYSSGVLLSDTRNSYDANGEFAHDIEFGQRTTWTTQSFQYNANGALHLAFDARGTQTTYDNFVCNGFLPTTVSKGGLTWGQSWDCNAGMLSASKAPGFGNPGTAQTTYSYNDPFFRPTRVTYPDGGQTDICYSDVGGSICSQSSTANNVTTRVLADPDPAMTSIVTSDGLGRTLYSQAPSGAYTTLGYDGNGHVCASSNPSFSQSPSGGLSCDTSADGIGVGGNAAAGAVGRPVASLKPIAARGSSQGTSAISKGLSAAANKAGIARGRYPSPTGGLFADGQPSVMRQTGNLGRAAGRWAPYAISAASTAYASYQLWNCLGH